jgi:hypothetical protein
MNSIGAAAPWSVPEAFSPIRRPNSLNAMNSVRSRIAGSTGPTGVPVAVPSEAMTAPWCRTRTLRGLGRGR